MKILALDLASIVGYAISPGDVSGICDITPRKNQRPGARYQRLRALLKRLHEDHPDISLVYFEQAIPFHKSAQAARYAYGSIAVVQLWCADRKIGIRSAHVMTVKKYITGKGNAQKQDVIDAIRARGFKPDDHNHADAIAIMLWATQEGAHEPTLV